jgi:hypothetical protein
MAADAEALGTHDYMKYLIVIHGGRNYRKFTVPNTKAGKKINIKYVTNQEHIGNIVFGDDGVMRNTGNCLLVGPYAIERVCNSTFEFDTKISSGEEAFDMHFSLGEPLPIQFGIYTCLTVNGDTKVTPMHMGRVTAPTWALEGATVRSGQFADSILRPEYDTLEKLTNFIVLLHSQSKYSDYPIDIIPLSCSVSGVWRPTDLAATPKNYVQPVDVDGAIDKLGLLDINREGGSKRSKRTKRTKRSKRTKRTKRKRYHRLRNMSRK